MYRTTLIFGVYIAVQAFVITNALLAASHDCSTNADCGNGCCYTDTVHGSRCFNYQNVSDPCHLPNHNVTVMHYPCGCAQGLTCDEIHFNTGLPDAVHQAELILLGHGYGLCTDTPGTLIG